MDLHYEDEMIFTEDELRELGLGSSTNAGVNLGANDDLDLA